MLHHRTSSGHARPPLLVGCFKASTGCWRREGAAARYGLTVYRRLPGWLRAVGTGAGAVLARILEVPGGCRPLSRMCKGVLRPHQPSPVGVVACGVVPGVLGQQTGAPRAGWALCQHRPAAQHAPRCAAVRCWRKYWPSPPRVSTCQGLSQTIAAALAYSLRRIHIHLSPRSAKWRPSLFLSQRRAMCTTANQNGPGSGRVVISPS